MRTMIDVRELEAHVSRTLAAVQAGEVFLITDRGHVIAELRPLSTVQAPELSSMELATLALAASGELRVARSPRSPYVETGVRMPAGTAQSWLDWTRSGS
jgi:antitoxin (DNA-binding transcriptional repressor) of toxin-antitoxin stability system